MVWLCWCLPRSSCTWFALFLFSTAYTHLDEALERIPRLSRDVRGNLGCISHGEVWIRKHHVLTEPSWYEMRGDRECFIDMKRLLGCEGGCMKSFMWLSIRKNILCTLITVHTRAAGIAIGPKEMFNHLRGNYLILIGNKMRGVKLFRVGWVRCSGSDGWLLGKDNPRHRSSWYNMRSETTIRGNITTF